MIQRPNKAPSSRASNKLMWLLLLALAEVALLSNRSEGVLQGRSLNKDEDEEEERGHGVGWRGNEEDEEATLMSLGLELEEAERGRGWKGVRGLCIERKGERGKAALCMFEI